MAKTKKGANRRPVKGKGIPAPRQAPARSAVVPLHKRRSVQAIVLLAVLAIIGAVVWGVLDARKEDREARRAVERFDKSLQLATAEAPTVFQEMQSSPAAFLNGTISRDEYVAQADGWAEFMRGLHQKIQQAEAPPDLTNAKMLFADGTLVYLDAVKSFRLAADIEDPTARQAAVQQGYNLIAHANGVFGSAQRILAQEKLDKGMSESEPLLEQPAQPAPEEAPIPQSPPEGPPPGGVQP